MRRFQVLTEGANRLNLRQVCEAFVNDLWVPDHLTAEQAAAFGLECFQRTVLAELEMLEATCVEDKG